VHDDGVIVLFMVVGGALVIFARPFAMFSLRPYFTKQELAELDKPEHRRLRLIFRVSCAIEVVVGLFFVVAGLVSLL
jgi:hypothetical protein